MGFFSFIGDMLGGAKPTNPTKQTFSNLPTTTQAAAATSAELALVPPPDTPVSQGEADTSIYESAAGLILFREAIMDNRNRLCGYRFLLRSALTHSQYEIQHIDDRDSLFFKLLHGIDIAKFAARRMAVIPLHPRSLALPEYRFMAAPNTLFQIDLRQMDSPVDGADSPLDDLIVRLKEMRDGGGKIALTGFSPTLHAPKILRAADSLFLRLSDYSLLEFQALVGRLRIACPNLSLVIEDVPTWAEQRMCLSLGAKYCLGTFVSSVDKDEVQDGVMEPGRLVSIEMLNLLRREADLSELSKVAKKDPAITVQLLKWANSPMAGWCSPVTTLDQAIVVIGRETLYRWLTMSIFRMGKENKERDESLLEVALTRARFLETIEGPELTRKSRDELFLVGMLSLFEALLSMPMERILHEMNLSTEISDVLLHSSGPYGRYLRLALVMERGRPQQIEELANTIGISMDGLESGNVSAFNWAQEALAGAT